MVVLQDKDTVSKCPLCKQSFGITLWKYHCAHCGKVVCDDCAPEKYVDLSLFGDSAEHRMCRICVAQAKPATVDGGRTLGGQGGRSDNPHDAEERERRANLFAQKMKPQSAPRKGFAPSAPLSSNKPQNSDSTNNNNNKVQEPTASSSPAAPNNEGAARPVPQGSNPEANPVLAAALRRQEAAKAGTVRPNQMDPERQKILSEIQAILKKREEDEPFGLRSMDATKMRMFLRHLQEKEKM